ncbi:MAG: hypothetical protein LBF70_02215 [Holosporales bacterium]|nr:hypothetical protein [Holosporales bacterium]
MINTAEVIAKTVVQAEEASEKDKAHITELVEGSHEQNIVMIKYGSFLTTQRTISGKL